jgi:hypothetical protein
MRWLILVAVLTFPAVSAHAQGAGDPVCAQYRNHWEQVSRGGDLAAMAQAAAAISPACPALKAEVAGRLAEARRRTGEHNQAAQAAAARQRAAAAEQATRGQAARDESVREAAAQAETAREQAGRDQAAALQATFDLIRATLASQGTVVSGMFVHDSAPAAGGTADWTVQDRIEMSNFVYDLPSCTFRFQIRELFNASVASDVNNAGIPLRQLQIVRVITSSSGATQAAAQAGHPTWSVRLQPEIYDLLVVRGDGTTNTLYFYDLQTANRMAEAVKHAAALCGVPALNSY